MVGMSLSTDKACCGLSTEQNQHVEMREEESTNPNSSSRGIRYTKRQTTTHTGKRNMWPLVFAFEIATRL